MASYTCPVCGGKLNIKIGSDVAECGSCGNLCECDPADIAKVRAVYRGAEQLMRLNTAGALREAIKKLEAISFVDEAADLSAECRRRLETLLSNKAKQQEIEQSTEKKNAVIGIVLLVVILLVCAAAVAGAAYLIIRIVKGTLPDGATPFVIGAAVLAAIILIVNMIKR